MQNIGIDLGTCNSCVAEFANRTARALVNTASNEYTTPSYITYPDLTIGLASKENPVANQTISSFKRLTGRRFTDSEVQEHIKRSNYKIINQDGLPFVQLQDNSFLSPSQISSDFLKQLKKQTNFKTDDIVLTVPAYFSHAQKLETERAGLRAGLKIMRLLAEPTAAALQYDMMTQNKVNNEMIMVLDLGAGTFDVSILEKTGDVYQVLAAAGNNFYGGDDYTHEIQQFVKKQFDIEVNFSKAERIKHALSASPAYQLENGQTIQLTDLQEIYAQLDEKLTRPILQTLSDANMKPHQISKVLLVGGQTKQPSVQQKIQNIMQQKPLTTLNPDLCVAQGASIQAAIMNKQIQSVLLLDATPFSLGIETIGGAFAKVLNRNSTLPAQQSQVFTTTIDNQDQVSIRIYQGDNQLVSQNVFLAEFILEVEKAPKGVPRILVTFEIDQNGVVNVSATDQKTGQKRDVKVKFGEQRPEQRSERDLLIEVLRARGVKVRGDESMKKLQGMEAKLRRRGK